MKRTLVLLGVLLAAQLLAAGQMLTRAESSNFSETSLYADVLDFLYAAQKECAWLRILPLATSWEGRMIPLVVLSPLPVASPAELRLLGRPAVLIMANIHAGEIEGKEACLMLLRDIVQNKLPGVLDNQVLLLVPIFNADGNEKLGHNRRDNGPELAGVRPNGQNLDLNRDYLKLDTPEVAALVRLMCTWDPLLIVDMHTTDGSYHRHPVTYTTLSNPNSAPALQDYMWQVFFPNVSRVLKGKFGYDSVPYGNFSDRAAPEKGWINDTVEPRYGTNYAGLRNRFTVLDENYSYTDFKTRVLASYGFIRAIVEFTAKNIRAMEDLARQADQATAQSFYQQNFALDARLEKLFDLTVKSYEFVKEKIKEEDRAKYPPWVGDVLVKRTDVEREYRVPYLAKAVAGRVRSLPQAGYLILPFQNEAVANLKAHGIIVERLLQGYRDTAAENFKMEKIELAKGLYQGRVAVTISGTYEKKEMDVPAGAWFVSLKQPLARLIPVLLEPESEDSLAAWGFFNRVIVQQWNPAPALYPVYRVGQRPPVPMIVD